LSGGGPTKFLSFETGARQTKRGGGEICCELKLSTNASAKGKGGGKGIGGYRKFCSAKVAGGGHVRGGGDIYVFVLSNLSFFFFYKGRRQPRPRRIRPPTDWGNPDGKRPPNSCKLLNGVGGRSLQDVACGRRLVCLLLDYRHHPPQPGCFPRRFPAYLG